MSDEMIIGFGENSMTIPVWRHPDVKIAIENTAKRRNTSLLFRMVPTPLSDVGGI